MTTLLSHILSAKSQAGPDAYLWAHDSGDVILWESESQSVNDDGRLAIGRWRVDSETLASLIPHVDCHG